MYKKLNVYLLRDLEKISLVGMTLEEALGLAPIPT